MADTIHENANYYVVEADWSSTDLVAVESGGTMYFYGYDIVNKTTGITEYRTPVLPDAIMNAQHMNHVLESRAWEWLDAMPDDDEEELPGEKELH